MEQNNDSAEADEKVICGMNSYAHDIAIFFLGCVTIGTNGIKICKPDRKARAMCLSNA